MEGAAVSTRPCLLYLDACFTLEASTTQVLLHHPPPASCCLLDTLPNPMPRQAPTTSTHTGTDVILRSCWGHAERSQPTPSPPIVRFAAKDITTASIHRTRLSSSYSHLHMFNCSRYIHSQQLTCTEACQHIRLRQLLFLQFTFTHFSPVWPLHPPPVRGKRKKGKKAPPRHLALCRHYYYYCQAPCTDDGGGQKPGRETLVNQAWALPGNKQAVRRLVVDKDGPQTSFM